MVSRACGWLVPFRNMLVIGVIPSRVIALRVYKSMEISMTAPMSRQSTSKRYTPVVLGESSSA